MSVNRFFLDFGPASGCTFTLTPEGNSNPRYSSIQFDILPRNYEQEPRTWSEQNTPTSSTIEPSSTLSSSEPPSLEPPSLTSTPVRVEPSVSASAYSSIAPKALRPNITLADDPPQNQFTEECLDPHTLVNSTCWSILRLGEWVQKWYGIMSSASCDGKRDLKSYCLSPGTPWTSNFLRAFSQSSVPVDCYSINSQSCRYSDNAIPDKTRVLAARYRYVSWTILSEFDPEGLEQCD